MSSRDGRKGGGKTLFASAITGGITEGFGQHTVPKSYDAVKHIRTTRKGVLCKSQTIGGKMAKNGCRTKEGISLIADKYPNFADNSSRNIAEQNAVYEMIPEQIRADPEKVVKFLDNKDLSHIKEFNQGGPSCFNDDPTKNNIAGWEDADINQKRGRQAVHNRRRLRSDPKADLHDGNMTDAEIAAMHKANATENMYAGLQNVGEAMRDGAIAGGVSEGAFSTIEAGAAYKAGIINRTEYLEQISKGAAWGVAGGAVSGGVVAVALLVAPAACAAIAPVAVPIAMVAGGYNLINRGGKGIYQVCYTEKGSGKVAKAHDIISLSSKKRTTTVKNADGSETTLNVGNSTGIEFVGYEVCNFDTGTIHTVRTSDTKFGIDQLNYRHKKTTSNNDKRSLLGVKAEISKTETAVSAVRFCGFEYGNQTVATTLKDSKTPGNWAMARSSSHHKVTLLFASAEVTRDTISGETTRVKLAPTDEGVALLGQVFSSAIGAFACSMREGNSFHNSLKAMKAESMIRMQLVAYDMLLTNISMGLCNAISTAANNRIEKAIKASTVSDKWIERLTPVLGLGVASLVRPLVDAFLHGFDSKRFKSEYFKSLLLNSIVKVLRISGRRTLAAIVQGTFSTVYNKWKSKGAVSVLDLIFDLAPLILQALAEEGMCAPFGTYSAVVTFAVSYLICPLLAETLKTHAARQFGAVMSAPLAKALACMQKELVRLNLTDKTAIALAGAAAGISSGAAAAFATTTSTAVVSTTVPSAECFGLAGWAGFTTTTEVAVTTAAATFSAPAVAAIGCGLALAAAATVTVGILASKPKKKPIKDGRWLASESFAPHAA